MKLPTIVLLTVAAGLVLGGVTMQARAQERRASRGEFLERAKEKLNLTEEQMARIKEQLSNEKDALLELGRKLRAARAELREVIQNEKSNERQIRDASAKVADVQADVNVLRHKLQSKIYPIFTSEQREKLKEVMDRVDEMIEQGLSRLGERLGKR
jgi:Spy/CpxP family protein refolding chaperone